MNETSNDDRIKILEERINKCESHLVNVIKVLSKNLNEEDSAWKKRSVEGMDFTEKHNKRVFNVIIAQTLIMVSGVLVLAICI